MSLSEPFINRPIATILLAIGLAFGGIVAFNLLPVSSLPEVDFPTISVQASYPGASPEIMATSVATPLERQIGRIAGVTQITSTSNLGSTNITIQFDLSRDINGAARDIQAAINAARGQLPIDLPSNPTYRKVNPADAPILIISLTSDTYTQGQLYDTASTILQQALSQVNGVGQVIVGGGSLPAVRVDLNPTTLNNYGIGLEDVRTMLATSNVNKAKGEWNNDNKTYQIFTNDQLFKANQYSPLIITYRNGSPVRLSDVAEVSDSVENIRNAGSANGKPAILLVLFKQPGANVIETVKNVETILPQLMAAIPTAMIMNIVMDRTTTIRSSLRDVEATLFIAMILVILVVYIFLANVRAMIIAGVAVPLSLLGTFGVMYLLNYSLDNLSLMALTISTGFVVDDAVVMLENIKRHLEMGVKPLKAALIGAKEVGFTVLSMSISLIAVFTPIIMMSGIVGRLFREFAITLSTAIIVSLIVSLTVTPMMCAHLLKHEVKQQKQSMFSTHIRDFYARSLDWSLKHQNLMLLITVAAVILNILLFMIIPKGFFPQQDTGRITGSIQAQQSISFQAMQQKLDAYINIIKQDPAVQNVVGFIGNSTTNAGQVFITLKSQSERKLTVDEVINRLRNKMAVVQGASLYLQAAQDIVIGGRLGNAQFQYTISSDNLQDLNTWVSKIIDQIAKIPQITDLNTDQLNHGLQEYITIDRDTAARLGISTLLIDQTLYDAFGQRQVSNMYTDMNQYHVVMNVAPKYWQHPESLNNIYINSPNGKMVPLSAVASFASSGTLLAVPHQGQSPSATLTFNILPGYALGDVVNMIDNIVKKMHVPENIQTSFQGTAQAFQASLANETFLVLGALLAVYIVLGMLYESIIHPITILSTLPSAGVGALLALLFTRTDLSIIALIGIILLIGIVKKNAIMMIDFALEMQRTENKTSLEAIYTAAILRVRPIMMTTMAAMFGAIPLAIGFGVGSEMRRPLGIAIIGGLMVSQVLTLYTTPVIYLKLEQFRQWYQKIKFRKYHLERGT